MSDLKSIAKQLGYPDFRIFQKEASACLKRNKDVFAVLPTGAGKSTCWILFGLETKKVVIIICPLISLMQDQVQTLQEKKISACCLNSSESFDTFKRAFEGDVQFIYTTPETFAKHFSQFENLKVGLVAVDEAHCVTKWGHDFRRSFLNLGPSLRHESSKLKHVPILAVTATATKASQKDIQDKLHMKNVHLISKPVDRENIHYSAIDIGNNNYGDEVFARLNSLSEGSAIVYVHTIKLGNQICQILKDKKLSSFSSYNASMDDKSREDVLQDFLSDKIRFVIATNAFGMGIDKPDVRLVIHAGLPKSIEAFSQESGRGGRDGKATRSVLLYEKKNFIVRKSQIEKIADETRLKASETSFMAMCRFVSDEPCRRRVLSSFFGHESKTNPICCDVCDTKEKIKKGEVDCIELNQQLQTDIETVIRLLRFLKEEIGHTYGIEKLVRCLKKTLKFRGQDEFFKTHKVPSRSINYWRDLMHIGLQVKDLLEKNSYGCLLLGTNTDPPFKVPKISAVTSRLDKLVQTKTKKTRSSKTGSVKKTNTVMETLSLYREAVDKTCSWTNVIGYIAEKRKIKSMTICKHLTALIASGENISEKIVPEDLLDRTYKLKTISKLMRDTRMRLADQLGKTPSQIDYNDLNLCLAFRERALLKTSSPDPLGLF